MLPLLSISSPSETGMSSRRKSVIGCRLPFSYTVNAPRSRLVTSSPRAFLTVAWSDDETGFGAERRVAARGVTERRAPARSRRATLTAPRAGRQPHLNRRVRGEHHLAPLAQHVRVDRASGAVDAQRDADGSRDLADGRAEQSHAEEPADAAAARAGSGGLDRSVAVRIGEADGRRARATRAGSGATGPAR